MFLRLEILTEDKIGMTYEIVGQFYRLNLNIISLEVFPNRLCVKTEIIEDSMKEKLKENIYDIHGVLSIEEIDLLKHETSEKKLFATIDSMGTGVIAVNKDFNIEIFNFYCEKFFKIKKEEVIGSHVGKLFEENTSIREIILKGEKFDNVKFKIDKGKRANSYIGSLRPIKGEYSKENGFVISIKDFHNAIKMANVVLNSNEGAFKDIIGTSDLIKSTKEIVCEVAKSDSTVLLRGESGTGKEIFAKAIYNLSKRKDKGFLAINCAALPDNLIESELFGYEKGSFTGALSGKNGLLKEANGGTVFLDEIGELPLSIQAKLLRVLQEGCIRRIGSSKEEKIDVRIIAATNRNLEEMIWNNKFRKDLYYRLNVMPIYIPPLRERKEDIISLVEYFIEKLNAKLNKNISETHEEFLQELGAYDWPGNVRELKNVIERAMILSKGNVLKRTNIEIHIPSVKGRAKEFVPQGKNLKEMVETLEKNIIEKELKNNDSIRKIAKRLGVSHTTIINKMKKYNLISNES
ncbi:sigma 54-interacting transcriptional regulator [Anaeromicrobium sediminis]|uniref:HTH-type transcriptional regulatory protein TyrR n=1 Tax=Anaeromicrobium sediminis TaxID=1478221 RepID=A0A267MJP5_9FIRM|nr:sigma 54-interacting transcriptional regulator [Anaeromicrobium sediminis]PAB59138.1 AAA family ATPase [Anaeromicrobium sediminis]